MINLNENLYRTQWLDLVFENRNKSYGAYQLRKHNNETTTRALFYTCILFSSLIILPWAFGQMAGNITTVTVPHLEDNVEVSLTKIHEPKPLTPPPPQSPQRQAPLQSIQYTNMVVAPADATNVEPPSQAQLTQSVISTVTTIGADATGIDPIDLSTGTSSGIAKPEPVSETTIFGIDAIESYPEFPGGQDAFIKFLRKNLRYPGMAVESGIQGKVILSFVIERNGELSHIKVLRGIGSGCDEEAIRVLSKSPKWRPGIQNQQNVRVAYTLPISFALGN